MLWRKTQTTEALPEVILTKPTPKVIPMIPSLEKYQEMANEVGFTPAKLLEAQILQFLSQNNISVYDYSEVDAYLTQKVKKEKKEMIWIWRPLRNIDKPINWQWGHWSRHGSYQNTWDYRPYDKPVPMRVLREVKLIGDKFPTALFFVSDYAVMRPDPFIMITQLDVENIIFDYWNEPDFGL